MIQKSNSCPEDGTCTIELIPNKSLQFKTDEFGKRYPLILDGNHTVLKYSYSKKPIKGVQDSQYSEVIYIELNNNSHDVSLLNKELKQAKIHLGILTFYRDKQGYYPIENGTFSLQRIDDESVKIDLQFHLKKVSPKVSELHEIISLKSN